MAMTMHDARTPATPVLAIEGLTITLPAGADRAHAVRDVSITLAPGRIGCLVGESGSGKSVIASAVMGLLAPGLRVAGGSIRLQGEELVGATPARLRALRGRTMAMVFQEPMTALNPVMRCGEQIEEMLAAHEPIDAAERKARVLAILQQVQLPEPERIYAAFPHQLSGGQRQRIVIAIALILGPALLICDEPTTALDVTTQAEILALIRTLQAERGTAVLFITHDFGVIAEIADEVVVLRHGQVVEQGAKDAVLRAPAQPYTRALLAAVPRLDANDRDGPDEDRLLPDVRGLQKTYPGHGGWRRKPPVHAVHEVSFVLRAGETIGIVGESGSGKSTVARCVTRLIEPSAGEVRLAGQPVHALRGAALSAFRRSVQIVFQDPYRSLNPRRTVGDSIVEGPLNFGVPKAVAWARARELMGLIHLSPDALRRYPSEFSGGQRQRLCIARALACEPKVLVADEAVSALDVSVQAQILALLQEVQQRLALGIVFITHDLRVASQVCDRVIVMHRGRVVEQGSAHEVLLHPREAYTRRLLDAAPGRGYRFGACAAPLHAIDRPQAGAAGLAV